MQTYLQYFQPEVQKRALEITNDDVSHLLLNEKEAPIVSTKNIKLGAHYSSLLLDDEKYHALPLDLWKRLLPQTKTAKLKYKAEYFDCDDFATLFKGCICTSLANAVALVLNCGKKTGHAYNAVVVYEGDKDKNPKCYFKLVEPQEDCFVDPIGLYANNDKERIVSIIM